jgi:hypothetical protein
MRKGILMILQPKVLVVKLAQNNDIQAESDQGPSLQRLAACDHVSSEFAVYSKGNVKTLLAVLDVLLPLTPEESMACRAQPEKLETHKLVFKTRRGSESPEDLEMLLIMSTASYTILNGVEEQYLKATPSRSTKSLALKSTDKMPRSDITTLVVAIEQKQKNAEHHTSDLSMVAPAVETEPSTEDPKHIVDRTACATTPLPSTSKSYEYQTLSGTSFVVLKRLFDYVAAGEGDGHKELPVCLMVADQTPDTLGRSINSACLSQDCDIHVGFDLEDNCFFVSSSVPKIKRMLGHLADCSHSSAVSTSSSNCTNDKRNSRAEAIKLGFNVHAESGVGEHFGMQKGPWGVGCGQCLGIKVSWGIRKC